MIIQLTRWGKSLALRLPQSVAVEAKLSKGDTVEVTVRDGAVVISPAHRKYTIEELIEGVTPENRHPETDWGPPVGREEW